MWTTSSRDNWERLVAAVIKREQIWQLCHQDSITTVNSDFSERNLSFSSNSLKPAVSSQLPLTNDSVVEVRKNGSGSITQKLFSSLLWRKKPKEPREYLVGIPEDYFGLENFSLRELQVATDSFSKRNIIGRGRFGKVYKGRLQDGSLVAVKRFTSQDQVGIDKELEITSSVAHRNVLHLRGICYTEKDRIHVFPYMANGSVASCLRERPESQPPLNWATRPCIALGVARGLDYLHHQCDRSIVHRDVKAANILLDEDYEGIIADFTLATFMDCNDGVVKGTIGHIAPEYLSTGNCSLQTDVFGFGVFLLELISGQRAFDLARLANDDDVMLVDWVKKLCEEKNFKAMVDGNLEGDFMEEEVEKMLQISLICTQSDPDGRPMMSEVVRMLEDGDGLAERCEEFSILHLHPSSELIIDYIYPSLKEVAGTNLDYSSYNGSEDELSGPR